MLHRYRYLESKSVHFVSRSESSGKVEPKTNTWLDGTTWNTTGVVCRSSRECASSKGDTALSAGTLCLSTSSYALPVLKLSGCTIAMNVNVHHVCAGSAAESRRLRRPVVWYAKPWTPTRPLAPLPWHNLAESFIHHSTVADPTNYSSIDCFVICRVSHTQTVRAQITIKKTTAVLWHLEE